MAKSKKKILFVANPKSGTRTSRQRQFVLDLILMVANAAFDVHIAHTQWAGHATQLTQDAVAAGFDYVVAVGGDGTVNEVARALVNTPVALGIVPSGSGNGLARHLGLSMQPEKALKQVFGERTALIDTCYLNDQAFFCTAGIGFDAFVAQRFAEQKHRGLINYIKSTLASWVAFRPDQYQLHLNNQSFEQRAFAITFANASQYGNNAYVAPLAQTDDGLFDVCVMRPFPTYQLPSIVWRLFNKTLPDSAFWQVYQTQALHLTTTSDSLLIHLDGDPLRFKGSELRVRIAPRSLKVLF